MKQKKTLLNSLVFLCIMLPFTFFFTGCQNSSSEKYQEQEHTPSVKEAVPNLNDLCQNLKTEMQNMSNQRTTLALEQVNQSIRTCLPLIDFPEQQELMQRSNQMYKQFLSVKRTPEQQRAFEAYVLNKFQYPTLQQHDFEKLNIRDQYLLRHQGQAYIELVDLGANKIAYQRNPQYLAKVFAPYLPEAESVFLVAVAEQKMQPTPKDIDLTLSPQEIAERALFWQKYQFNYPDSLYQAEAHHLAQHYTALLFRGSANRPVSDDYNGANNIDPASLTEIQKLAQLTPSKLTNQAKKFLVFIELNTAQRQQLLSKKDRLNTPPAHSLAQQQLNAYLDLSPIHAE